MDVKKKKIKIKIKINKNILLIKMVRFYSNSLKFECIAFRNVAYKIKLIHNLTPHFFIFF